MSRRSVWPRACFQPSTVPRSTKHADYMSFAEFNDPDGNVWILQERGFAAPAPSTGG
jgi:hypothetical protein